MNFLHGEGLRISFLNLLYSLFQTRKGAVKALKESFPFGVGLHSLNFRIYSSYLGIPSIRMQHAALYNPLDLGPGGLKILFCRSRLLFPTLLSLSLYTAIYPNLPIAYGFSHVTGQTKD